MQRKGKRRAAPSKRNLTNRHYQTYLPGWQHEALSMLAQVRQVPETEVVREAISKYLVSCKGEILATIESNRRG